MYYEYDLNQQLTAETQTDDTGAVVYAWEWDYDRAGNRLWQTFNGEATYYTYNAGNELVTETTGGVTTYYEYDRNGNQTAKQAVDGTTYFHYDFENLLRQIDLPDGAHNYFTYDADSKRVSAQDSSGYTRFIYQGPDMLKLLQERNAAGETQAQYTMGQGLESMRRGAASSFFHYDALGSTQELTDAGEAVTDTYRYNAWGEVLAQTGSTVNPHRYVGLERYYSTSLSGFYQLGYRHYDALVGRFVSVDPAWLLLALGRGSSRLTYTAGLLGLGERAGISTGDCRASNMQQRPGANNNLGSLAPQLHGSIFPHAFTYAANDPVLAKDPLGLQDNRAHDQCMNACGVAEGIAFGEICLGLGILDPIAGLICTAGAPLAILEVCRFACKGYGDAGTCPPPCKTRGDCMDVCGVVEGIEIGTICLGLGILNPIVGVACVVVAPVAMLQICSYACSGFTENCPPA